MWTPPDHLRLSGLVTSTLLSGSPHRPQKKTFLRSPGYLYLILSPLNLREILPLINPNIGSCWLIGSSSYSSILWWGDPGFSCTVVSERNFSACKACSSRLQLTPLAGRTRDPVYPPFVWSHSFLLPSFSTKESAPKLAFHFAKRKSQAWETLLFSKLWNNQEATDKMLPPVLEPQQPDLMTEVSCPGTAFHLHKS